jgi:hypothetical protein
VSVQITATVVESVAAVKLTAAGATGEVHWFRRYGGVDTPIGTGAVLWDYGVPLNLPHEYRATDDETVATAGPVTVTSDRPVLASTISNIAARVTVRTAHPLRGEGQSVWHPVLGRSDPYVTIHPALYPAGSLILHTPTAAERQRVRDLLERGEQLLLRSTCPDRIPTMNILMTSWEWESWDSPWLLVEFQQVTDEPGLLPPPPDRTYQTVLDESATYAAVLDAHATYRDLLDGRAAP